LYETFAVAENIIWFSSALTFFGILFLGSGTYLWYRKQKLQDTKEQLETEKLRLEVKNMTPEQIAEKVLKEAESDIFLERQDEQIANESSPKVYAHNYFRIENILISKLITCFGIENVLANQRARNQEFDVVVTHGRRMDDYIFEPIMRN
jgi:hypothetical protein